MAMPEGFLSPLQDPMGIPSLEIMSILPLPKSAMYRFSSGPMAIADGLYIGKKRWTFRLSKNPLFSRSPTKGFTAL